MMMSAGCVTVTDIILKNEQFTRIITMFNLESFINDCRVASALEDANQAKETLFQIMQKVFETPQAILANMPDIDEDEKLLFDGDACQVWYCGFNRGVHIPPHDHQCYAYVGVYDGVEVNHLYTHDNNNKNSSILSPYSSVSLGVGDILPICPNDIHSVESGNGQRSKALHVYLGNLSTVQRSLFDWRSGEKLPFSEERFNEFSAREDRPSVATDIPGISGTM